MNANEPTLPEESLFLQAIEIDSPDERVAFLNRACGADAALRNSVEALLKHHREGTRFLETPPTEVVVAAERLTIGEAERPAVDFLSPSNDPLSLGRLGYYEVLEVLGHGGFGVVLKARDTKLDRIVAVKTLAQSLASSATARKRFVREAKAAAAVKHENVVGIYHVADDGPVPYLVMECVSGVSLEAKLQQVGTLDLPAILRIGMQIASGLAAAHKQGLVHRDVKPGNILLENGVERVKITDFGLARAADDAAITKTGEVAGTPQYMSPEQAQGLPMDARSDLFSLGSVLYAMATGRSPFRAESTVAALRRVCDDTPRPVREINSDIPDWLEETISRLLAKQPSERYQTATEVADLLGLHLAAVQQSAIVPNPKPTIDSRRHPSAIGARWWSVALIALVAMACIMGLTEASGVTKVVPTVIRIVRGEGTLVIEVDDPTVQVSLDGEELSIRGAGLQELRLRPGKYRLHATKGGQPVKDEVVTITRDGRKVVTVTLEGSDSSGVAPSAEATAAKELKLLTKLQGHVDRICAVAFLPDGQRMVSVGRDNMVCTWDLETRSVLSTLPVAGGWVGEEADVSADGRFVALIIGKGVRIWDLENGKQICEMSPQNVDYLNHIRFSPDGTRVVTSGKPYGGVLWDACTGVEVQRFDVDKAQTFAVQFAPDGRLLAMGTVGRVRLFDVESGDVLGDARLPQNRAVLSLAFSPSGDSLACGQMGGHATVIDVNSRRVTGSLTNPEPGPHAHVNNMQFLDDKRLLLVTRFDGALEVWDLAQTKIVATAASGDGTGRQLAVSPDGHYALTAHGEVWDHESNSPKRNGDYALRLWQLPQSVWPKASSPTSLPADTTNQTAKPAAGAFGPAAATGGAEWMQLFNGHDLSGWKAPPSQPGNWRVENGLLIGSGPGTLSHLYTEQGDFEDFHLRVEAKINLLGNSGVYFRALPQPITRFPAGYEAQICIEKQAGNDLPENQKTGSLFGLVRQDQVPGGAGPDEWFTMEILAHGPRITIQVNGVITVNEFEDPRFRFRKGHLMLQQGSAETVVCFKKIEIKALSLESKGADIDLAGPSAAPAVGPPVGELKLLAKLDGHTDVVRSVAFLPDGQRMVSVGRDRMVRIWDMQSRSVLSTLPVEGYLKDADVSADGRFVAMISSTAEKKGVAHVWDLEKRQLLWELPQDFSMVHSIRFSADSTKAVTTGNPPAGVLWDLTTGKEIRRWAISDTPIAAAAAFSPDGGLLALGAVGRVRLIDMESGDVLGDVVLPNNRGVNDLQFTATGDALVCGQASGNVSLIDVSSRQVVKSLQASDAPVVKVRLLDHDRFILTTCFDSTLRLLDIERGKVLAIAATEKGTNERVTVSPDGRYAITASGENWEPPSGHKPNGDYALRLWRLPESVWPKGSPSPSSSAETATPKDP